MKIEIIQKFYDYSWRVHNPTWSSNESDSKNVNVTTHIKATDIDGKKWDLLDNGNRYNNKISQNEHSRYDLILETFIIPHKSTHQNRITFGYEYDDDSNYNSIIFHCCELNQDFNPEITDSIELSKDMKEHYIGFAEQFIEIDSDKYSVAHDENPYTQSGIRCEMRLADNMFRWLNENNPMNSDDYDERCRKQTQIILLDNLTKIEATKALNNAIENELEVLDLGSNIVEIITIIERYKKERNEK